MKITLPPATTNTESNLLKQAQVFALCYNPLVDHLLVPPLDCPVLDKAHSTDYLDRCRRGANGFGPPDYRKVSHAEFSSSAMMIAAHAALAGFHDGVKCAFAPVSGFHHAGHNFGGGYCTFNGLMVAAIEMRDLGVARRILIMDGDAHYGNGTDDIIHELKLEKYVTNVPMARPGGKNWRGLMERDLAAYDLVLYQAGADAHRADPYGAGYLSDGDWIARDMFVFRMCKDAGVPIVWNLAGGYNGNKTIDLHTSTFQTACEIFYPNEDARDIDRADQMFPDLPHEHEGRFRP